MEKKQYTWESSNVDVWHNDLFDTEKECIEDALANGVQVGETIYIGQAEHYTFIVDANDVLERLCESAGDEIGEVAEDWPYYEYNKVGELTEALTKCVTDWLTMRNDMPTFYKIVGTYTIVVGAKGE